MPNWVANVIEMPGIAGLDLYSANELGKPEFDFNKLIPMPEYVCETIDKPLYFDDHKPGNWYDWSCQNWSTKWNADSTRILSNDMIRFETAWKPPYRVISKLSQTYPDTLIHLYYCDEINGGRALVYRNGIEYLIADVTAKDLYDICWNDKIRKTKKYHINKFAEYDAGGVRINGKS